MTPPIVTRNQLLHRPHEVAALIEQHLPLATAVVIHSAKPFTALELTFQPTIELEANGYPVETARITQLDDQPNPFAVPTGPVRSWHHRNPRTSTALGSLCLWYPQDPPHLRWTWANGFLDFVAIVQRHLWFEEHFRRHGEWPVPDAPHGERADGQPHPVPPSCPVESTRQ